MARDQIVRTRALLLGRRAEGGLTLVELMVTLSIAAVLAVIGVPSIVNLIRDARLSSQADLLVATLNRARAEAIRQRADFQVCPATSPQTATGCTANSQTWGTGWIAISGTTVAQRVEANTGVTVTAAFDSVTFRGTFGSAVQARSFTVCAQGRKQQVVAVNLSGNVSKSIGGAECT